MRHLYTWYKLTWNYDKIQEKNAKSRSLCDGRYMEFAVLVASHALHTILKGPTKSRSRISENVRGESKNVQEVGAQE